MPSKALPSQVQRSSKFLQHLVARARTVPSNQIAEGFKFCSLIGLHGRRCCNWGVVIGRDPCCKIKNCENFGRTGFWKIHENLHPWKFPALWYIINNWMNCTIPDELACNIELPIIG